MFNRRNVISFIFASVMIIYFVFCIYQEYGYIALSPQILLLPEIITAEAVIIATSVFCRISHIAGYLICGLMSGYKFISAEIFGFVFRKENGHIAADKYKYRKTVNVAMEPPEMQDGNFPFVLYRLGGVLIYSFFTVVMLSFSLILFFSWEFMLSAMFFCSFSLFAANAVLYMLPVRKGAIGVFPLIRLLKNDEIARELYYRCAVITAGIYKGIRLSEQDSRLFAEPSDADFSDNIRSEILFKKMWRFLDEKNFSEAERIIDLILDERTVMSDNLKNYARLERIFIELVTEKREEVIKSFLSDDIIYFADKNQDTLCVLRLKYALARFYYYNEKDAELYKDKFIKLSTLSSSRYPADAVTDIELFNIISR